MWILSPLLAAKQAESHDNVIVMEYASIIWSLGVYFGLMLVMSVVNFCSIPMGSVMDTFDGLLSLINEFSNIKEELGLVLPEVVTEADRVEAERVKKHGSDFVIAMMIP